MHTPLAYPKKYNDEPDAGLPEYFRDGEVKPTASNEDMRLATNRYLRFLDDLFGDTMQQIKDAGQWHNTIVYFTSDNGGAMYLQTAQNNYPLRAGKFSTFEGMDLFEMTLPVPTLASFFTNDACPLMIPGRWCPRSPVYYRWLAGWAA